MSDASPDPDMAAAETALGLLEGAERTDAERRRLSDPAFAREVEAWSMRLGRIAEDEASSEVPPARVWAAIANRLDVDGSRGTLVQLRRKLRVWRIATAGAGAAAAALAVALLLRPALPTPAPPPPSAFAPVQTARLAASAGGRVVFVAVFDPQRGDLVLTPVDMAVRAGKSPELWAIPTGGKPVPLGVARFGEPVRLKVANLVGGEARRTLAVSIEPEGGSPTGQPTGPVVATGQLQGL